MTQHGEKKIVILTNQIVDIELTKLFCFPSKFSVFPKNLFVEPTKEFVIAFCLTKLFIRRTKILLRLQKKVCQFYIFLRELLNVQTKEIEMFYEIYSSNE